MWQMLLNFLSRDSREWFENIKQIISICAERMKEILVVFDVPEREGGSSHELSSKIWNKSGWDSKWGDRRREKKTPNPNNLLMVSFRRGPLGVKVLQSWKAIYCNKTRAENRCCFFHQREEGELEQVLWLVPSHGLGNTVFIPRYPCLSESRWSPGVSAIILHHDSLQPLPVLLLCFKTGGDMDRLSDKAENSQVHCL